MAFLWPPRPERAVPPNLIQFYEDKGYVAQVKFNGTCQVVSINDKREVTFNTRHAEPNKAWVPLPEISEWFSQFPGSVFVGELLHNKHPSVKNTIVLFDLLRFNGISLVGNTLEQRLAILRDLSPSKLVHIIETHRGNLTKLYASLTEPTQEGIVMKDPQARLRDCQRDGLNTAWQVKVRRPTKNYGF